MPKGEPRTGWPEATDEPSPRRRDEPRAGAADRESTVEEREGEPRASVTPRRAAATSLNAVGGVGEEGAEDGGLVDHTQS